MYWLSLQLHCWCCVQLVYCVLGTTSVTAASSLACLKWRLLGTAALKLISSPMMQVLVLSPSGIVYMGGQRCPKEVRNSTRLWIQRDPSLRVLLFCRVVIVPVHLDFSSWIQSCPLSVSMLLVLQQERL